MSAPAKIETFASFLAAVVAQETGSEKDVRLQFEAAASGLNESTGSLGGYLVPTEFAEQIWSRVYSTGRLLARCDRQPVTKGDRLAVPTVAEKSHDDGEQPTGSRFGGAQMYWTDEAGPGNDASLKLEMIQLHLHKLLGLVYTSDELVQDSPALAAAVARMFGLEAAFSIENAIINGDGIAKPLGILNSPSLITIDKDDAQQAGTVSLSNLHAMAARLWGPSHGSAIWMMGNEVFGQVMALDEETGSSLFEVGPNGERMLLQMPIELNEYTPAIGQAGDIVLGDLSQYLLAEKEANTLSSLHVRFKEDESAIKVRYRVDGAPAWRTPIKPKNSADTQSPFIALGART